MPTYFNAAGHGLPDSAVYRAMAEYLQTEARIGPIAAARDEGEQLVRAKQAVASVLTAGADQLGFTSTTTTAWNIVVGTLDLAGKRVLVTEHEWGNYCRALSKRSDVEIQVLPPLNFDKPDYSAWIEMIDEDVAAIFVPLVTSIAGYRYPVEDIGSLPRPAGTKLIVDAAQALGQTEVNITQLNSDAVISTCRKWLRGPRQTALLWINDRWANSNASVSAPPLVPIDQNPALMIGLGVAAQNFLHNQDTRLEQQLRWRADSLRTWAASNGIAICGGTNSRTAIVSLDLGKAELAVVSSALENEGIIVKTIDVQTVEPFQRTSFNYKKVLRISAHVYNSDSELEHLKEVVAGSI